MKMDCKFDPSQPVLREIKNQCRDKRNPGKSNRREKKPTQVNANYRCAVFSCVVKDLILPARLLILAAIFSTGVRGGSRVVMVS